MTNMPLQQGRAYGNRRLWVPEETARPTRENPGPSGPGGFNRADLVSEGRSWGILATVAEELVDKTLDTLGQVLSDEGTRAGVPEAMLDFVAHRQKALADEKQAGHGERSTSLSL